MNVDIGFDDTVVDTVLHLETSSLEMLLIRTEVGRGNVIVKCPCTLVLSCLIASLVLPLPSKESSGSLQLFELRYLRLSQPFSTFSADLFLKTVIILGQTVLKLHARINGTGKGTERTVTTASFSQCTEDNVK